MQKGSTDATYDKIKKMIESGIITEFSEIFDIISRSEIARKLKKNTARDFTKDAERLSAKHVIKTGEILDVKPGVILDLINNQYQKKLAAIVAKEEKAGGTMPRRKQ